MKEKKELITYLENNPGFIKYNNIHVLDIKDSYAKMSALINENSLNPNGTVHGGLIFGLADSVMGIAARTTGHNVVTIDSSINYLHPGKGSKLIAETEKIKVGKKTAVYRCNIYDEKDNLIAIATGTYYFID